MMVTVHWTVMIQNVVNDACVEIYCDGGSDNDYFADEGIRTQLS